jgi:hypothetical protein
MCLGLLVGMSGAFAQTGNLEDLIRQQAVQRVQAAMGGGSVPQQSTAAAAVRGKAKTKTIVPFAPRKSTNASVDAPAGTFKCLPTCDVADGRFLAIAGSGLLTLSPPELELSISVPAGSTSFDLGVFDGDGGEYQSDGFTAFWDSGDTAPFEYTLYADPQANGTGTTLIELQPGFPSFPSSSMPDNDWIDFTVNTGPEAAAPSGNFFYLLKIRLLDPSLITLNAFKVRSNAVISGLTLNPVARPFSYIATWTALTDISVVYPSFPSPTPTTYDGTFRFFVDVPVTQSQVFLWDGDFDHGNFVLTDPDTDDPDTPSAPLPPWSTSEVRPEGVAVGAFGSTGDPADDNDIAGFGIYMVRPPAVRYDLVFPDGQSFANDNPSGNQEWEQFKVSTAPFDRSQMDYHAASIPPGIYQLNINGVDMLNLNALLLPYRVLCVDDQGVPSTLLRPYRVGDTVFADSDGDGNQGPGENGIAGVVLELRDPAGALVGTTTTDANGHYRFETEAGTYTVDVAAANFTAGGALAGLVSTTGDSRTDTVNSDNVLTYDFGYRGNGSIGNRVWLDDNADGVQDSGEAGINGVTVQLLDGTGNVLASATTAGDGNYSFDNLSAGTYSVRVDTATLPAGFTGTYDLDGTATADRATLTLGAGAHRTDVDFGYHGGGSLGDRVWFDLNNNGIQDANESGINGVTVELLDNAGTTLATKGTTGDGGYTFTGLAAGTYTVHIVAATLPAGASPTFDADGTATPDTATVSLTAGQTRTDIDFGYRGTAAAGDRVWFDLNGNGVQEPEEGGLNGVTVELLDGAGNVLSSAVTAGNGGYSFAGLFAGSYTVRVAAATLPNGAVATFDLDGTGTANTAAFTLTAGQNLTTADFGYRGSASLGDRVWLDLNNNAAQDSGETGINGVAVELLDSTGNVLASSSTAGDGLYGFAHLFGGTYTVRVVTATLPAGLVATYDLDGTATPGTTAVTLTATGTRADVDFGYRGVLQFGDRVWFDYDGNGIQDTGEPGINGVVITLKNSVGTPIATTTTSGNGNYVFTNLPAGLYSVNIVPSSLPGGAVATYDLDGTATPNTAAVTLTAGQSRTDVDFGYRGNGSLGDRVWLDYNANGVQDAGEIGINGVTVQLRDTANNLIATATTAGDGNYSFPNLLPGTYKVSIVTSTLMAGAIQTYDLDGTGTANTATASVAAGQSRSDVDFGYRVTPPGTGTIGYWKTHAQAWPVSSITIGGVVYTRDQAITILSTPSRGDKSIDLFDQLVAAKLNLITGNNPSCIYSTVSSADAWMAAHPPGSGVSGSSAAWTTASPWHTQLDNYNNGLLCAAHRN